GGYQLFGSEYLPEEGAPIPGLGVLDVRTKAGKQRFVGNLVAETPEGVLVGFENHSGRTYLGSKAVPLGAVLVGHGNNGEDRTEGAIQGKIVGTYSHGSCLPKNPWLADKLLAWALERRHTAAKLIPLDDREERAANEQAAAVAKARP
ncbi:MAG TPA: glutamine amidotransferase, partial [Verrucomicrobiae bacterium]|nr:glutamine amidotransferase [Verrucomicrobiae bacterium]